MIKWEMEKDIIFIVKSMDSKYVESTIKQGRLCFNTPQVFDDKTLNLAQYDKYDSWMQYEARDIYIAPLLEDNERHLSYGKPVKILEKATIHEIDGINKSVPICCFRKIDENEITVFDDKMIVTIETEVVDRIKNEFGHNSFILIVNPNMFLDRICLNSSCYAHSIYYTDNKIEFEKYIESVPEELVQAKMFQKEQKYAWQKEYRVILPPISDNNNRRFVEIGNLEDIAIVGEIEQLSKGVEIKYSDYEFIRKNLIIE